MVASGPRLETINQRRTIKLMMFFLWVKAAPALPLSRLPDTSTLVVSVALSQTSWSVFDLSFLALPLATVTFETLSQLVVDAMIPVNTRRTLWSSPAQFRLPWTSLLSSRREVGQRY